MGWDMRPCRIFNQHLCQSYKLLNVLVLLKINKILSGQMNKCSVKVTKQNSVNLTEFCFVVLKPFQNFVNET